MRDFGYSERARDVENARADIHAAFAKVVNRNDGSDPRTRRWQDAIIEFRRALARVYPEQFQQGDRPASELDTADILDFLEADPRFFGSGYMKERLLREVKKRKLRMRERERLQSIVLHIIHRPPRREFLYYCRAARTIDDEAFRQALRGLSESDNSGIARRASWMLAALEPNWNWRRSLPFR